MMKLAPEWVRTSDPVIRSPARYRWTTAPAVGRTGGAGTLKLLWIAIKGQEMHFYLDRSGFLRTYCRTVRFSLRSGKNICCSGLA